MAHLCEYLLLAWLLRRALEVSAAPPWPVRWMAWSSATAYGLLMELLQAMVPWRTAEAADAVANALGAALGVWFGPRGAGVAE